MARPKRISDEAVLDGVIQVMTRVSPADLTLAAVAAEVGIAPATLLQRFGDKQTLILRALSRDNGAFERQMQDAPRARGRDSVIDLFWLITPESEDADSLCNGLLWLREDFTNPELRALAQERFRRMRAAIAERLPPLAVSPDTAARLLEAQWQGAVNQWGFFREGALGDYVARALNEWFDLAEGAVQA